MKAVVFHGIGDIRLDEVNEPSIQHPNDAIVRITASTICGTDLHIIHGTMGPMVPGTILGHEAVGVVEQVGPMVRNVKSGDRVIIPSTIACGYCSYCRAGYYAQCDTANPNGKRAGTAFFGGPESSGPFDGLQAEKARVPFANMGLVKIPDSVTDKDAICLSDVFPSGYFGADLAEIAPGDSVAVFGCGPVGLFAIKSAILMNAGRVLAVDQVETRLATAREIGAEIINFGEQDPVQTILQLTAGIGVDRVIDAVGVDLQRPESGPTAAKIEGEKQLFERQRSQLAPKQHSDGENRISGSAPCPALQWAVEVLDKAGTLAIIGVYPQTVHSFPIGQAMNKNLTINMGNCNHRRYIPQLLQMVETDMVQPSKMISDVAQMINILDAYKSFDLRKNGWVAVEVVSGEWGGDAVAFSFSHGNSRPLSGGGDQCFGAV